MEFVSITVVVGANDEKTSLVRTVDSLMKLCGNDIDRVLLVRPEKVSAECTAAINTLQNSYPGIAVDFVQHRPYVGGAIRDGFDTALTSHIMLLPGDDAVDLAVLPEMISEIKKSPYSVCKISRWINKHSFSGYSPVKKLFNAAGQIFLRLLFSTGITDLTCPVQIMPTSLYKSIDWKELNFPFLEELVLVPLRLKVPFKEFPTRCYGRKEGKSSNSVRQTALYLKTAFRIRLTPKEKLLKR